MTGWKAEVGRLMLAQANNYVKEKKMALPIGDQREDLHKVTLGTAALGHGHMQEKAMSKQIEPSCYDPLEQRVIERGPDTRTFIMQKLNAAQLNLQEAYKAGMEKNAMVQDVPAFTDMQKLSQEISAVMQKVAKVRGL